jgi:hypothetical protein
MYTRQISYSASQPLSRTEAKNFCKVPALNTNDDALIDVLIASAIQHVENVTSLSIASKNYVLYLDEFPNALGGYTPLFGSFSFYFGGTTNTLGAYPSAAPETNRFPFVIPINNSPVTAVAKIIYLDVTGAAITLLPGQDFVVDLASQPARVGPIAGGQWPRGMVGLSSVQVYFTAGFTSGVADISSTTMTTTANPPAETLVYSFVNTIPADLKVALMLLVSDAYFNREVNVSGAVGRVPTLDNILMANRSFDFSQPRG